MKEFIKNIENHFNEKWQSVFLKGSQYLLSPSELIDIFYFYHLGKDKKMDRDTIMYKMSDISMDEMVQYLNKIKREALAYLS